FARMALSQQFKDRSVSKVYLAAVQGHVAHSRFTVARPLGRHPSERKRISVNSRRPRDAVTEFSVIDRFEIEPRTLTLLTARPRTGRTHQIRVHLAASGHPCVGDALYGGGTTSPGWSRSGQALHALSLTIEHPRTGKRLDFMAPLPDDITKLLTLGGVELG